VTELYIGLYIFFRVGSHVESNIRVYVKWAEN